MDVFIEYMVKKKKKVSDYLMIAVTLVFGVLAMFISFGLLMTLLRQMGGSIAILAVLAIGYLMYRIITGVNLEYEYSLVNSEIDVDKIVNVKNRKRMTTVNIRGLEAFGKKAGNREFNSYMADRNIEKVFACRDKEDDDVFYAVYLEKEKRKMILFNPSEKMIERINQLNPQKAFMS